jgi:hypothetical protein
MVNAVAGALDWVLRHGGDPLAWFEGLLDAHTTAWALEVGATDAAEDVVCSPA